MNQIEIKLEHYTPLSIMASSGRTAWKSFHKGGVYEEETDDISLEDRGFIDRIVNKLKHGSVSEHLNYHFKIKGVSRALLQELVRHRHMSFTVSSTRYTLKELKSEEQFNDFDNLFDFERASKYLIWTGNHNVDITSFFALEDLRRLIKEGISNDIAKYALCESYKVELAVSINARSLQNFLQLRTNKAALWEIRELAYAIFDILPEEHKYLFEDYVYEEKSNTKGE